MEYVWLLYLVTGAIAAFMSGLMGIGGATIFVPVLIWSLPYQGIPEQNVVPMAFATSMVCVMFLAMVNAWTQHKRGFVRWDQFWMLASSATVGMVMGIVVLFLLKPSEQKTGFAVFLAWMAWNMWRHRHHVCPSDEAEPSLRKTGWIGWLAGLCSGVVGIAGAVMLTSMLKNDLAFRRAVGTAVMVSVPLAIVGVIGYGIGNTGGDLDLWVNQYQWSAVVAFVFPSFFITRIGVSVASQLPVARLKHLFSIIVFGMAMGILVEAWI